MLKVGGFTPLSTTDWPNRLAAVVFVQGCPWRCGYCHNEPLQPREGDDSGRAWLNALGTLTRRQGLLDGVVFSGGEPTLDPDLPDAIDTVRQLGLQVGLHTAGIYPDRLKAVLDRIDWIGFDLKAGFADYARVTAIPGSGQPARRSFDAVLAAARRGALTLEVRTTWHPALLDEARTLALATTLRDAGVREWVLQGFRAPPDPSPAHQALVRSWRPPSADLLAQLSQTGLSLSWR